MPTKHMIAAEIYTKSFILASMAYSIRQLHDTFSRYLGVKKIALRDIQIIQLLRLMSMLLTVAGRFLGTKKGFR